MTLDGTTIITPETEKHWETRRRFRDDLLDYIDDRLFEDGQVVESGPLEGVRMVALAQWRSVIGEVRTANLPPVSDHAAEVVTGATVLVWAKCPRCHIAGPIALTIEPELRVDDASAELRLRAKAKPRTHVCGQLTIPVGPPVEGQESFELEDIVGVEAPADGSLSVAIEGDPEGEAFPDVLEVAGPERPCPACGTMLAPADTHWSIFPEPMGGYVCPVKTADKPTRTRKPKATPPAPVAAAADDLLPGENLGGCPWPGCQLAVEHPGAHQTAVDDRPDEDGAS